METIKFLMDNILLWIVISIFVLIVWSVMMGDPDSSDLSNIILTVICALIALPITILILIIIGSIQLLLEYKRNKI
jgi:NADH:ubiquinone oxidoreductase subunit 6 (subunit J)